jgi:hypothetical protein
MLKHILLLAFTVVSVGALAQTPPVKAYFDSQDNVLANHDKESWSTFKIEASETDVDWMKKELSKYEKEFRFEVQSQDTDGKYNCKLVYSHHIDLRYLHKTFTTIHVQSFDVGSTTYQLNELPSLTN